MQRYKLLVVTSPNVPEEGLRAVLDAWVARGGGTLLTTGGAAVADRYDEPLALLADATGVREAPRESLFINLPTAPAWASDPWGCPSIGLPFCNNSANKLPWAVAARGTLDAAWVGEGGRAFEALVARTRSMQTAGATTREPRCCFFSSGSRLLL
jgi:hypothetical protein